MQAFRKKNEHGLGHAQHSGRCEHSEFMLPYDIYDCLICYNIILRQGGQALIRARSANPQQVYSILTCQDVVALFVDPFDLFVVHLVYTVRFITNPQQIAYVETYQLNTNK